MEKRIHSLFVDIRVRLKKHRIEQCEFAAPTRRLCDSRRLPIFQKQIHTGKQGVINVRHDLNIESADGGIEKGYGS